MADDEDPNGREPEGASSEASPGSEAGNAHEAGAGSAGSAGSLDSTREDPFVAGRLPGATAETGAVPGVAASPDPTLASQTRPEGQSGTSVMPVVPGSAADGATDPPRWSARAQVPTPELDRAPVDTYWAPDGAPPRRGVWGPVLMAVVVVILLGVLAIGLWLLLRGGTGTPVTPGTTDAPVTTAPTTTRTRPAPTATTAAAIPVPDLRGQDYAAAAKQLTTLGFVPQRSDEPSSEVAAGKVIGTDPPAGNTVRPGATIVISVSTGAPTPPPTTPPVSPTSS